MKIGKRHKFLSILSSMKRIEHFNPGIVTLEAMLGITAPSLS